MSIFPESTHTVRAEGVAIERVKERSLLATFRQMVQMGNVAVQYLAAFRFGPCPGVGGQTRDVRLN